MSGSSVCTQMALSPWGLLVFVILIAAPYILRRTAWQTVTLREAALMGPFAVFVAYGGCKGLAMTGWIP